MKVSSSTIAPLLPAAQETPKPEAAKLPAQASSKATLIKPAPIQLQASDDALFAAGRFEDFLARLEDHVKQVSAVSFQKLDSHATESWISELFFLQQRLIGVGNKVTGDSKLEKRVHTALQTVCNLQTTAFNRACEILDEGQTNPLGAWVVYKNTMKKQGYHHASVAHDYYIQQAKKFIEAGGNMSDIKVVSAATVDELEDGVPYEYVVDEYNTARLARCVDGEPTPGHTLLAGGNDALAAGTLRRFGNLYIVGTMSGHFRTPFETTKFMVDHLVKSGVPKERIVVQEGEAGTPRAIEIIHRARKSFGDDTKALVKSLQQEATQYNPSAVYEAPGAKKKPAFKTDGVLPIDPSVKELPIAVYKMQSLLRTALKDSMLISADGEAARVLAAIDHVLVTSEIAGNKKEYTSALAVLRHLGTLDEVHCDADSRLAIKTKLERWTRHVFGTGATTAADVFAPLPQDLRRMRIVATLNPKATDAQLKKLILAGMDVARINVAHGSNEGLVDLVERLRKVAKELSREVRVQIDLPGPKIRLGKFANPNKLDKNDIQLTKGDTVKLTTKPGVLGDKTLLPVEYDTLGDDVKVGEPIYLNDGNVKLIARSVTKDKDGHAEIDATIETSGIVWDRKGVNLPYSTLSVPTVGDDDVASLKALLPHVDLVAMSFVRHEADIFELKKHMMDAGKVVPIIAKIERREGLERLERIADAADALMVARGDLGVEIGYQHVPTAEQRINAAGDRRGKPVMVATEAMMSMVQNPSRPTRGEVEGLASAIRAGAEAIMLGKETSAPDHADEVIRQCAEIIKTVESAEQEGSFEDMLDAELEDQALGAMPPPATMSLTDLRAQQRS